ncbi:MAG: hypothetical protein R2798_03730 [Chitinophagales bacterium]|nr:hypothetical protein [Bacteroidota bacterium]MCB9043094.1 hypothetical protein [Chitinophagales bacterium]
MKKIETDKNGELSTKDSNYFGGKFSIWEKVRKKGIGSPKIIYDSGIAEFDKLKRNVEGEISFVNFELLKNGLILRLNLNQRFSCVGIKLDELIEINLVGYRVKIKRKKYGKMETKIVHRGELEFVEINETAKFVVIVREFESLRKYFEKEELREKLRFSISTNPPEKDYGHLLEILGIFN